MSLNSIKSCDELATNVIKLDVTTLGDFMKKLMMTVMMVTILSGCANVPDPIAVSPNDVLVPYVQVANASAMSPQNQKARWGGKIVSVENKEKVSEIEVVFFPEGRNGKPNVGDASVGRFIARVEGFVDPLVFEQGRLITVVGEVGTKTEGIIGEQSYLYPTLNAMGYHMWKETQDVEVDTFSFAPFGYHSRFNVGYFNPFYRNFFPYHQRTRFRMIKNRGHSQGARVSGNDSANNTNNNSELRIYNQPPSRTPTPVRRPNEPKVEQY